MPRRRVRETRRGVRARQFDRARNLELRLARREMLRGWVSPAEMRRSLGLPVEPADPTITAHEFEGTVIEMLDQAMVGIDTHHRRTIARHLLHVFQGRTLPYGAEIPMLGTRKGRGLTS